MSAVRYTSTSLAEVEKKPPSRKEPTRSATGTGSPASARRLRIERLRDECAFVNKQEPSRTRINGGRVGHADVVRHQALSALLFRPGIECPDIGATRLRIAR